MTKKKSTKHQKTKRQTSKKKYIKNQRLRSVANVFQKSLEHMVTSNAKWMLYLRFFPI